MAAEAASARRRRQRARRPRRARGSRRLIASPFHTALVYAFVFAIVACLVAAVASLLRGGKYPHVESVTLDPLAVEEAA